ncbi:bifunctional Zinc finger [Babesia duncani]|uniref:Bifunctional Zinc finger n=1 Tax=Babesia duncani TaxID=323732 RepID=A0AAD9PMH6_9APIC|nr:bifunctional Zinc finger [Babesia duncani]
MENCASSQGVKEPLESFVFTREGCENKTLRQLHLASDGATSNKWIHEHLEKCKINRKYIAEGATFEYSPSEDSCASSSGATHVDDCMQHHLGNDGNGCNQKLFVNNSTKIRYVVLKCKPPGGYIDDETVIYIENSLVELERLNLLWNPASDVVLERLLNCLVGKENGSCFDSYNLRRRDHLHGPFKMQSIPPPSNDASASKMLKVRNRNHHQLDSQYNDVEEMLFHQLFMELAKRIEAKFRVFYAGQVLTLGDFDLFISLALPCHRPGIITPDTEIYIGMDVIGEFSHVAICPLEDTLPKSYEYNLLKDYLEPFFENNRTCVFYRMDSFQFNGIQFRIVDGKKCPLKIDHDANVSIYNIHQYGDGTYGRVGANTSITIGEAVHPNVTDLLPPESMDEVRRSPPCMKLSLLLQHISRLNPEDLQRLVHSETQMDPTLPMNFNLQLNSTICQRIPTDASHTTLAPDGFTCTVCCTEEEHVDLENVFIYPCGHIFHRKCVEMWLSTSTKNCPNCRCQLYHHSSSESQCTESDLAEYFNNVSRCDL